MCLPQSDYWIPLWLFSNGKFHTKCYPQYHTMQTNCTATWFLFQWNQNCVPGTLSSGISFSTHYIFAFIIWCEKLKLRNEYALVKAIANFVPILGCFLSQNPVIRSMKLPAATRMIYGGSAMYYRLLCAWWTFCYCGIWSPFLDWSKWIIHKWVGNVFSKPLLTG